MLARPRRWFSAPLVVVTAGCSSPKGPVQNPPPPEYDAPTTTGSGAARDPTVTAANKPPGFGWIARTDSVCEIGVDFDCSSLPPGSGCNPPMPQLVECPDALPPGKDARVTHDPNGSAANGTDCLLLISPCSEPACGIPVPCQLPPPATLQWTVSLPAGSKQCSAAPTKRSPREPYAMPIVAIDCPKSLTDHHGFIERAKAGADCLVCATSPCTGKAARPIKCPVLKP